MSDLHLFETSRLRLHPFRHEDVESLHALWCDPLVRKFLWDDIVIPFEAAREVVAASLASFEQHGFGFWNVALKKTVQALGFCGLRFIEETSEIEILYGLWPKFWGKGFATEASLAVLRFGFETCKLERILAGADPPNVASIRVMERLGMKFDRQTRRSDLPIAYYALTRAEWQAAQEAKS